MSNATNNPARIRRDSWIARFGSILAWAGLIFWGLIFAVSIGEVLDGSAEEPVDKIMPFVCLGLAGAHVLLLLRSRKTKGLIKDFRIYCAVFAREPDRSVPEMAKTLNIPLETALSRLQEMCRRGYFNGYIDHQKQQMVFHGVQETQNLHIACCPGCGARTAIARQGDACRYCGSPLHI